ncbi:MAG: hypothetical protein JNM88_14320 [Chitinophagaceae bacterium]|nr:hypothetical protein [Chitinophagaceae bacterium]
METNPVSVIFLDKISIFYFGFKAQMENLPVLISFLPEKELQDDNLAVKYKGDFICYHITTETGITELNAVCRKIRKTFPDSGLIGCFDKLNAKMLPLIKKNRFRGLIMMEDTPQDILHTIMAMQRGESGLSKGFMKQYLLMKHRENKKNPRTKTNGKVPVEVNTAEK